MGFDWVDFPRLLLSELSALFPRAGWATPHNMELASNEEHRDLIVYLVQRDRVKETKEN